MNRLFISGLHSVNIENVSGLAGQVDVCHSLTEPQKVLKFGEYTPSLVNPLPEARDAAFVLAMDAAFVSLSSVSLISKCESH